MPSQKRKIGDIGEKIALDYLRKNRYKVMGQNYQKPWGEIDIIVQKDNILIFVEVKTRTRESRPEESVRSWKQHRLIKTAQTYILENNYPPETSWQIDIIAVELNFQTRKANLKHIKNAIWQ